MRSMHAREGMDLSTTAEVRCAGDRLPYFDAHCIMAAREPPFPVDGSLIVSTRPADWQLTLNALEKQPGLFGSLGVHPWFVGDATEDDLENLHSLLADHPQLGVGEIGLDKSTRHKATFAKQKHMFESQFLLAARLRRRVSIHCVRCHGTLLEMLKEFNATLGGSIPPAIYMHSWSGSLDITRSLLRLDGFGPRLFFGFSLKHNSDADADVLEAIPASRILVESDLDMSVPDEHRLEQIRLISRLLEDKAGISSETLLTNASAFLHA